MTSLFSRLTQWAKGSSGVDPTGSPRHLHVYTNIGCELTCRMCYGHSPDIKLNLWNKDKHQPTKPMDFSMFEYALSFLPHIETIVFSGWGEPMLNPDLFKMVFYAYESHGAVSTVITNGLHLEAQETDIFASPLKKLVVSINGYSPESYQKMTGMSGDIFKSVYRQVRYMVAQKRAQNALLPIWISVILDNQSVFELPHVLQMASKLQVDGVELLNYLPPDPSQKSDRSLTSDRGNLRQYLAGVAAEKYPFTLMLPKFLDSDMQTHRHCRDPFESLSLDGDGQVSNCSRALLFDGKMAKVWDKNFWQGDKFDWLRRVHQPGSNEAVPRPCQACPHNCQAPRPPLKRDT